LLKALKKEVRALTHNYTIPLTLDGNQIDNLAKGRRIRTAPQFRQELKILVATS